MMYNSLHAVVPLIILVLILLLILLMLVRLSQLLVPFMTGGCTRKLARRRRAAGVANWERAAPVVRAHVKRTARLSTSAETRTRPAHEPVLHMNTSCT